MQSQLKELAEYHKTLAFLLDEIWEQDSLSALSNTTIMYCTLPNKMYLL